MLGYQKNSFIKKSPAVCTHGMSATPLSTYRYCHPGNHTKKMPIYAPN